jgi:glycosyltransferase involved in cell wall biosynthesis
MIDKNKISFIIPSRNNAQYLKLALDSIRKYYPNNEICIANDGSSDNTFDFIKSLNDPNIKFLSTNVSSIPIGHTILYDYLIKNFCTNSHFVIFHADMICSERFLENILKYWEPKTIVSATRIEPPLHPVGKEKIIQNFGLYDNDFKSSEFETFVKENQIEFKDKYTKGFFAPWFCSKEDFIELGGHDPLFAPYPNEDCDLAYRAVLNNFNLIQSWDSFVYHFTCRGHKFPEKIGVVHELFDHYEKRAMKNFLRKWGFPPILNEYSYPKIVKKFNIGLVINHIFPDTVIGFEPLFDTIYTDIFDDSTIINYINSEQESTSFDLKLKFKNINEKKENDIIIYLNGSKLPSELFNLILEFKKYISENIENIEIGPLFDYKGISFYRNVSLIKSQTYSDQFRPIENKINLKNYA